MQKKGIFSALRILAVLLISLFFICPASVFSAQRYKILHIMSYHSPWEWTDDQIKGFQDALSGVDYEFKVFQMDTKRKSSEEWKEQVGKEARDLIDSYKPDLVYTNDDNAQKYVVKFYVNNDIPFVFSAVNSDPDVYGFTGSKNITGILEHEHSVETINLLRQIIPSVKKIAIIIDDDPTWPDVINRIKERIARQLPDIELTISSPTLTFEEYKQKIKEYQTKVDALGLLGVHTFKDENGRNVSWQEVLEWTADNSNLPDFSFWKDRIPYGTLCTVYVSGYEQGLRAGKIARGILVEGRKPSSYPMEPTIKGKPIISLARAKKLGIMIKSTALLTAEVVEKFEWEK
jgi:ABC-type uncharacterized transport system substrate-binding protein